MSSVISEIESPFTLSSKTFNNTASSCTLTVPYGTKDAYIAARWTESVFKGGIIENDNPKSVIRKNHLQNVNFKVPIIDEIGFQNLHLFRLWMISPTKS